MKIHCPSTVRDVDNRSHTWKFEAYWTDAVRGPYRPNPLVIVFRNPLSEQNENPVNCLADLSARATATTNASSTATAAETPRFTGPRPNRRTATGNVYL